MGDKWVTLPDQVLERAFVSKGTECHYTFRGIKQVTYKVKDGGAGSQM